MSEEKFWPCGHLVKDREMANGWALMPHVNNVTESQNDKYNFMLWNEIVHCPICGTKFKKKSKKLAQILFEAFQTVYEPPLTWEKVTSKKIKAGSQAQAEVMVKLVQDLCRDDSVADIVEKMEEML